jgi:hypothetical protein
MTIIGEKRFRCPDCGGDTVREFCETLVSCEIVRFGLHDDGCPFVEEETDIALEKTTGEPWYECAECRRQLGILDLPAMVAEAGE